MRKVVGYIAGINFICFLGGTVFLGGDALSGRIENGLFFLSSHGKLTEVTQGIFNYSKYHALSIFLLNGLALIFHLIEKSK